MRPELNLKINPQEFLNYYWLKEELSVFCKQNNLPGSGSKDELTNRIYLFLKTGKITEPVR
ncbi:MAG TPA: SAP domain-containing protein, partial [Spirochaetota bacterium]|nr:SAP domain-containing protein [Spirochaetota bacterium]